MNYIMFFISLSIMFSSLMHVVACIRISFIFMTEPIECIYYILSTHSPVDGHLDCFSLSATMNYAVVNLGVQIPV